MNQAKEALKVFIKSLPEHSLFNICSFGSTHSFLTGSTSPVGYNNTTVAHALSQIKDFDAQLGGTELYTPLKRILARPSDPLYPRSIFVLTDGNVMK